ncbi:MAG: 6-phosphofructokinase, partial [Firmicutes bacterium]|nr:6-phosphofructokinase [Bacillota bacterium]
SHKRTFVVEIMGNKVGWLTLYAGLAGGANVILLPEIPYDITKVIKAVDRFTKAQSDKSCIIAVAEGAMDKKEVSMGKKERSKKRTERGETTASNRIAAAVGEALNIETRVVVPGHTQRGGIPSAYDRVLCTQIGAYGADLVAQKKFGVTVALQGNKITYNQLADIAGKPKLVPMDHPLIQTARSIDVSFGE